MVYSLRVFECQLLAYVLAKIKDQAVSLLASWITIKERPSSYSITESSSMGANGGMDNSLTTSVASLSVY